MKKPYAKPFAMPGVTRGDIIAPLPPMSKMTFEECPHCGTEKVSTKSLREIERYVTIRYHQRRKAAIKRQEEEKKNWGKS